jgi:hypothetical protein
LLRFARHGWERRTAPPGWADEHSAARSTANSMKRRKAQAGDEALEQRRLYDLRLLTIDARPEQSQQ